jgi:hypothetical protein
MDQRPRQIEHGPKRYGEPRGRTQPDPRLVFGVFFLQIFHITLPALKIAGGIILILFALAVRRLGPLVVTRETLALVAEGAVSARERWAEATNSSRSGVFSESQKAWMPNWIMEKERQLRELER